MEQPPAVQRDRLIWVGIGLTFALVLLALGLTVLRLGVSLSKFKPLPVYGTIADFSLTNQLGNRVSLADLKGQVWVADIIFTRCAGPCLKMSRQMKELQQALPANKPVRLVSLTTDPEFDTPPVLQRYAERFGADPKRWYFLTGTKQQIAALAADSLKLTAVPKEAEKRETPVDLFIHSTIFVVVDKHGQLRGVFETTGDEIDPQLVKKEIFAAVHRLERER